MSKLDRMALYEAPRVSEPGRRMIEVELVCKGVRRNHKSNKTVVKVPATNPMPEVVLYEDRIFLWKKTGYFEATIWPIIKELDT